jgi:hypothetical protein
MILKAKGFKWEAILPLEEKEGLWLIKPEDLKEFLEIIAFTHDTVSGGFAVEINRSE